MDDIDKRILKVLQVNADLPVAEVAEHLRNHGVEILTGPVPKDGATGPIMSIYFRDPEGNLVEIANPIPWHGSMAERLMTGD